MGDTPPTPRPTGPSAGWLVLAAVVLGVSAFIVGGRADDSLRDPAVLLPTIAMFVSFASVLLLGIGRRT